MFLQINTISYHGFWINLRLRIETWHRNSSSSPNNNDQCTNKKKTITTFTIIYFLYAGYNIPHFDVKFPPQICFYVGMYSVALTFRRADGSRWAPAAGRSARAWSGWRGPRRAPTPCPARTAPRTTPPCPCGARPLSPFWTITRLFTQW